MTAPPIARADVRPEIQGLRAVAVAVVVVCHFWPSALPGGFVGVDVFFAISGFLITSHLLREVAATGRVSLAGFWARRARRILPAALLVLALCALATLAWVPEVHRAQFFAEIRASTFYVENWQLAHTAVDYFAADQGPSPAQHFWSLSAEEQFYLFWPVLILAAAAIGLRARSRRRVFAALALVTAGSLGYSVSKTGADPAAAYFVTPTRAWEFGLGGLLAFAASQRTRAPVAVAGLVAIAVAAATFSAETAFPGVAALLPVLGACAVIWSRASLPGLSARPAQYVGDISYGVYLWHWSLLILAPYVVSVPRGALVVLTLLLAAATKRWVEDPIRRGRVLLGRPPRWTLVPAGVATALVIALTLAGTAQVQRDIEVAQRASKVLIAQHPRCFGAASRAPRRCTNPRLRLTVVPTPAEARDRPNAACGLDQRDGELHLCGFGLRSGRQTVALVGDSHASHWRAALDVVARDRGWAGISLAHAACPLSTTIYAALPQPARSHCVAWNRQVARWLRAHPDVHTLMLSAIAGGPTYARVDAEAGYLRAWRLLPRSIRRIIVIRDTPKARLSTDDCVERALDDRVPAGTACRLDRGRALAPDPQVAAAHRLTGRRVQVLDMTRFICDRRWCYPVIGGALVYKDDNHLTEVFARTLGPYLDQALGAS
jgi:peptidoglycan/LPS O-acetylase OafA/YrhL